jgi:hypothetical protein
LYIDLFAKASLYRTEARMKNGAEKTVAQATKKLLLVVGWLFEKLP